MGLGSAGGYFLLGGDPLLFVALVPVPDVTIAAYLVNPRVGSVAYNVVHTLTPPVALLVWGLWAESWAATVGATIWLAHLGADRAFGLGLKYADVPVQETHLQRV